MACASDISIPVNERRTRVVFQSQTTTPDDSGGAAVATWVDVSYAWVKMTQKRGNEAYKQQSLVNNDRWEFAGVYGDLKGVTTLHRIFVNGTYYNIRGINNVNFYNITINIDAEEGVVQ